MASEAPSPDVAQLPSVDDLKFVVPTDEQVCLAIINVMKETYDGQRVVMERRPQGNLGYALRKVCANSRVVVPDPVRLADILNKMNKARSWAVYPSKDMFVFELYQSIPQLPQTRSSMFGLYDL